MKQPLPLRPGVVLLAACTALAAPAAAQDAAPAPDSLPARTAAIPAASAAGAIRIDGVLDDAGWEGAHPFELPYEFFPGDNTPAPVRTECRIAYDTRNLYLGCVAHDPHPERIRASFTDRDRALGDDHIVLTVDPFRDRRRAFQFRVSPLGVQMDALVSLGAEDFSWDAIWSSAGRITEEGYVVEAAIPFRSLRFPRTAEPQSWGIIVDRVYPRDLRRRFRSVRTDRSDTCLLCQAGELSGLAGIAPGRDVEVNPTFTASRTDRREGFPDGPMDRGEADASPGVNLRWGVTPNVSLNGTLNPDFSQVEADVAQLTVNQRFAVSYPEKRPFFLEGSNVFQTFAPVVFTRRVVDPWAGFKVTGKEGGSSFGAFVAQDRANALIFPGAQSSAATVLEREVTAAVVRYQRDVGHASNLGVVYTGRTGEGYANHVAAVDGLFRLSRTNTFRAQVMRSSTEYPEDVATAFAQPEGAFGGMVWIGQVQHASRGWNGYLQAQHLDAGFRGDAGFLPRMNVRVLRGTAQRVLWGKPGGWYNRLSVGPFAERLTRADDGSLTDQSAAMQATYHGPLQSVATASAGVHRRVWNGRTFDMADVQGSLEVQPGRRTLLRLSGRFGGEVDFLNTRGAMIAQLSPGVELRLGRHVSADLGHTWQRLSTPAGEEIFTAHAGVGRLVYNFSTRAFLRGMLQYQDVRRNPYAYAIPVAPEQRTLASQLLFAYKVNPQTVMFVGYSDNHLGQHDFQLTRSDRSFFLKLGYAWRV